MDDFALFAGADLLTTLVSCRKGLEKSPLLKKLDEVIAMEIELARIGSEKALKEVSPKNIDRKVVPIK